MAETSFWTDKKTLQLIQERTQRSRSETIRDIVKRYVEVCRRHRPDLERKEWYLIVDAFNGTIIDEQFALPNLAAQIEDAIALDDADKRHAVDGEALLRKLRNLTYAEKLAVVDIVDRFWADVARKGGASTDTKIEDFI